MNKLVNIGKKQRRTRGLAGYALLTVAAVLAYIYINQVMSVWWVLALFVLVQSGAGLVLEAKHGVCPLNAVRGKQSMNGWFSIGQEDFKDKELLPQIKQVAFRDQAKAVLVAFLAAVLLILAV